MGQRGPKPLPGNVHLLRGNASKKSYADLTAGVNPPVEIPGSPKHLLPDARQEWKRQGARLKELGLIAEIDRAAFALYCQAWAKLVWHEEMYQRDRRRAADLEAAHDAAEAVKVEQAAVAGEVYSAKPWTGGDGLMIPTPNGAFMYNPHWVAGNKEEQKVDKYLASFGMSPSSRGRVSASSNQLALFGSDKPAEGSFQQF